MYPTFGQILLTVCATEKQAVQKKVQREKEGYAVTIETVTGKIGYDTLEFCDPASGIADAPTCKWLVTARKA
jgi:hypothetical protein